MKLLLIGAGLIGGSAMLEWRRSGVIDHVVAVDINHDNLQVARAAGWADEISVELTPDIIAAADVVLLSVPVAILPDLCRQLAPHLRHDALVTDVGSTKSSVIDAYRKQLPEHFAHCVAAHPIAGSDRHGASAAHYGLFEGKKCIICPHEMQDENALEVVEALWRSAGARITRMSAVAHDDIFAAVSHLPHLLAYAYVRQIAAAPDCAELLYFAGSGFRDFTRIAASSPEMWRDICLENRAPLLPLMDAQIEQLSALRRLLDKSDGEGLRDYFQTARDVRGGWG